MSTINIQDFVGEMPSRAARALPAGAAQENKNLRLATVEFQPLPEPEVVSPLSPGLHTTLYRVSSTAPWLVYSEEVSHVRGQIAANITNRTYLTYDDGTSLPRVIDDLGNARLLGVPSPLSAPALSVNVVDEFRVSEIGGASDAAIQQVKEVFDANLVAIPLGIQFNFTTATPSSFGWDPHPTSPSIKYLLVPMSGALVPAAGQPGVLIPAAGTTIKRGFEFLQSPGLYGKPVMRAGSPYWQVEIRLFATVFEFNDASLLSSLAAIPDLTAPTENLFLQSEVARIGGVAATYFNSQTSPQKELLADAYIKTGRIQKALESVQANLSNAAFFASDAFNEALTQLIGGAGNAKGSVTQAILSNIYAMTANTAFGQPGNISSSFIVPTTPTRYWQPDFAVYGGFTEDEGLGLIRADINECILTSFFTQQKILDLPRLRKFVLDEYLLIVSRRPTEESRNYYQGKIERWVDEALRPLVSFFSPDNLTRMKLGLTGTGSTADAFLSAVREADDALQKLEGLYGAMRASTGMLAINVFKSGEIGAASRQAERAVTPIIDDRFYIATYVNDWDEESAPSPVSVMVSPDQNDTIAVAIPAPPVDRHINRWRLYRTNAGLNSASFQFVAEGPTTALAWSDGKANAELGEVCQTTTWREPPIELIGLVGAANGIMAGFGGSTVAFCEPYIPYAWPVEYQIVLETPIVGMVAFGQSVFVGTKGSPYLLSGADPASMSAQKMENLQACASRRSMCSISGGAMYASPDGLCLVNAAGVQVVSADIFSRDEWQALNPATMIAEVHEMIYYVIYTGAGGGCLMFDLAARKLGRIDLPATALYVDLQEDALYAVIGNNIVRPLSGSTFRLGRWRSPKFVLSGRPHLAWIKVMGDQSVSQPATVQWIANGVVRHTSTITDMEPQRLPPGRWLEHEVLVTSRSRLARVILSGTAQELQQL